MHVMFWFSFKQLVYNKKEVMVGKLFKAIQTFLYLCYSSTRLLLLISHCCESNTNILTVRSNL